MYNLLIVDLNIENCFYINTLPKLTNKTIE